MARVFREDVAELGILPLRKDIIECEIEADIFKERMRSTSTKNIGICQTMLLALPVTFGFHLGAALLCKNVLGLQFNPNFSTFRRRMYAIYGGVAVLVGIPMMYNVYEYWTTDVHVSKMLENCRKDTDLFLAQWIRDQSRFTPSVMQIDCHKLCYWTQRDLKDIRHRIREELIFSDPYDEVASREKYWSLDRMIELQKKAKADREDILDLFDANPSQ